MANIGRNDPCPCGSGRKYKHCCLQQRDAERVARAGLRQAEARVVPAILGFALQRWGREFILDAWDEFVFGEEEVPVDIENDPDFQTLFLPWFVFSYIPDPRDEDPLPNAPVTTVGSIYLSESPDLPPLDRELIESACAGGFTFYAVQGVEPGESIALKDILTGGELRALEHSASTMIGAGDILFAFAATAGAGSILLGSGSVVIPPPWHNEIINFRQKLWNRRRPRASDLATYDLEIRDLYFDIADALVNPRQPVLTNTDGDPLRPTSLEFELRCSVLEAHEALKNLNAASDDDQPQEASFTADGEMERVGIAWVRKDQTLLGTLALEPGRLTASVNSLPRATQLRREIAKRLGSRVSFEGSHESAIDDLGAPPPDAGETPLAADAAATGDSPQLHAAQTAILAQHWDAWVDERVPALGNKTPRQAVKTAIGRERLEALFVEFAWRNEQAPAEMRVDLAGLRRKLGI